jgi:hypothetical protein
VEKIALYGHTQAEQKLIIFGKDGGLLGEDGIKKHLIEQFYKFIGVD